MAKLNFPTPAQGKLHTFAVRELRRVLTLVADVAENDPNFKDTVSAHLAVYTAASQNWVRPLTGIAISGYTGDIQVGSTVQLGVIPQPTDALLPGNPVWESQNEAVATVSATGEVTGVSAGTAVLVATVGGFSATQEVTVVAAPEVGE